MLESSSTVLHGGDNVQAEQSERVQTTWLARGSIPEKGLYWPLLRRSLLLPTHLLLTSDQPIMSHARTPLVVTVGHTPCEAISQDTFTIQAYW